MGPFQFVDLAGFKPKGIKNGGSTVNATRWRRRRLVPAPRRGEPARQGDPGSTEALLSLEDPLLELVKSSALLRAACPVDLACRRLFRKAQRRAERAHARARYELLKQDRKLGTVLAFSGGME